MTADATLFENYLFLHKEMLDLLRSVAGPDKSITTNMVILSIHVIRKQIEKKSWLDFRDVHSCPLMSSSSSYRVLGKMIEYGIIKKVDQGYKFKPLVPDHLLISDELQREMVYVD